MIFDDPAENERGQRPQLEGELSNTRGARRADCMHGENLRNPTRGGRAGGMRWFRTGQINSIFFKIRVPVNRVKPGPGARDHIIGI